MTEGALTDTGTEIVWLVCGNPTEPDGRFFECFNRQRHRWNGIQIDSRSVPGTNTKLFAEWVQLHGEDSDFVRVRVRGVFPRQGSMRFISSEAAEGAMSPDRDPPVTLADPLVMGVDVARFGDDASVICFRRGRDARTLSWIVLRGADLMTVAARVAEEKERHQVDAIFVDGDGLGGGVIDRLRQLRYEPWDIKGNGKPDYSVIGEESAVVYANKRAENWGQMRSWLPHGAVPASPELLADLTGIQFGYVLREGRDALILERKEAMKARGLASPDLADALALTFAYPVAAPRRANHPSWPAPGSRVVTDWDPHEAALRELERDA